MKQVLCLEAESLCANQKIILLL